MKQGFTLIELLVVVLIIGILSSVALPQYTKAVEKARASEAIQLLGDLATAEQIYQMGMNAYEDDLSMLDLELPKLSESNKAAYTKNFRIAVINKSGSLTAKAERLDSTGSPHTTGDLAYTIGLNITSNGDIFRWCEPHSSFQARSSIASGTDNASKICKAIANNKEGIIK